jgi:DNA mismatch repair protein MutS2
MSAILDPETRESGAGESARAHGVRVLEFEEVRKAVAGYSFSEEGRERVLNAEPLWEPLSVLALKETGREWLSLMEGGAALPLPSLPPIAIVLTKLGKDGIVLDIEDFYAVGTWGRACAAFKAFLSRREGGTSLAALGASLPDASKASDVVFSILTKDGELKDLPSLRDLKNSVARIRSSIGSLVARYFQDDTTRQALQSDVPTQRNGRTVLAVRANYRGRIRGIVHESSATGQTVYIEPDDVVERNNDLVAEEARLKEEIQRILREASDRLRPERPSVEAAVEALEALDADLSRARYTARNRYAYAEESESSLELYQARHPLLGGRAVPIDVQLPEGTRVLIVSGPNTGGKTVSLKTAGLLSLMNQFGLGVPAAPGSRIPVFSGVYADIGDEQSLSQSLSTFSAHMRNVSAIVREAGDKSLVLLDELGSGTDPEEGSAIGMALLDAFLKAGSLTIVTSHHGILKNYGYTKEGCVNASVDFDGKTLSPTYRIVMGVPGESHALDIALRNGLDPSVVEGARSYLADERADVAALIRGLKSKHLKAEELERVRERRLKETIEERRRVDLKELRLKQKELELKKSGAADTRRLLEESRKGLENLVRELKEGEITRDKTLKVKEFIKTFETLAHEEGERLSAFDEEVHDLERNISGDVIRPEQPVREGSDVLYGKLRRRARVLRAAKKGSWVIETENARLTVAESELTPIETPPEKKASVSFTLDAMSAANAVYELDLRGMRREEALKALERQIDAASLSNLRQFGVIHGTGEGILKDGIREYLSSCRAVEEFAFARPEDGGFGKTIVKLR